MYSLIASTTSTIRLSEPGVGVSKMSQKYQTLLFYSGVYLLKHCDQLQITALRKFTQISKYKQMTYISTWNILFITYW